MANPVGVNPKTKDSVFADLFSIPENLLELYRVLHPEDKVTTVRDLREITTRCVIAEHPYNDLGFLVGDDRLIILVEAQSTWSPNIVIRMLIYMAQTLSDHFNSRKILLYKDACVKCPRPELYVIYTGDRKSQPEILSFRDLFFSGDERCDVDASVHVIYERDTTDIINQYVLFCKVFTEQHRIHGRDRKTIEETIRICRDRNILNEYLRQREKEIMDIMTSLFDQDYITHLYGIEQRRDGIEEGKREGKREGMVETLAQNLNTIMIKMNLSLDDAMDLLNVPANNRPALRKKMGME